MRAARHEPLDLVGALDARARSSTPLDTSTPKGRTCADGGGDVAGVQAAGEDDLAAPRELGRRARQSVVCAAAADRALEQHAAAAAAAARRARPQHGQHAQRAAAASARRGPRCRSAGCRAGNPAGSRRLSSRVGCRVTATQRDRPRAGARARLARCGRHRRTEAANTKPIASTSQASAVLDRVGVVMPQILMNGVHFTDRVLLARHRGAAFAPAWRAAASRADRARDISALPTSARS